MKREDLRFMNYTPHEITIVDVNGKRFDIVSHGTARVVTPELYDLPIGDIPVIKMQGRGIVVGLPGPMEGIAYLVSREVLNHLDVAGRTDVFSPATRSRHNPFYDGNGRVVGVTRLLSAFDAD